MHPVPQWYHDRERAASGGRRGRVRRLVEAALVATRSRTKARATSRLRSIVFLLLVETVSRRITVPTIDGGAAMAPLLPARTGSRNRRPAVALYPDYLRLAVGRVSGLDLES